MRDNIALKSDLFSLEVSNDYFHIKSREKLSVLSSAVLNGGVRDTRDIVNLRVPENGGYSASPEETLRTFCISEGWGDNCVGMMTAASMKSLAVKEKIVCDDVFIAVALTLGLSNPRCAGDRGDIQEVFSEEWRNGTINIVMFTNAELTPSALAESIMIVTEAKCEAMRQADVRSPLSGKIATGTGTDSVVIAAAGIQGYVEYCGKHTLFGEVVANLTISALMDSMEWYNK
jgi:adenosylcobinamide amidohydrolase